MPKTYKLYYDASHGWLAVKRIELIDLGIADKISGYSYQRGGTVYLEEDRDMPMFIKAKGWVSGNEQVKTKYHNTRSPIRSYDSYVRYRPYDTFVVADEPEHGCGHMQGRGAA